MDLFFVKFDSTRYNCGFFFIKLDRGYAALQLLPMAISVGALARESCAAPC
jgi:hypothetical protein